MLDRGRLLTRRTERREAIARPNDRSVFITEIIWVVLLPLREPECLKVADYGRELNLTTLSFGIVFPTMLSHPPVPSKGFQE